jgi:1-pyrroline-5-carboxylate dehydrogenase
MFLKAFGLKLELHINHYNLPRIVGETGGKDFIIAHPSANPKQVSGNCTRHSNSKVKNVQLPLGLMCQKYVASSKIIADVKSMKMGSQKISVISLPLFMKVHLINWLVLLTKPKDTDAEIIVGGNYDKSVGYFIEPNGDCNNQPSLFNGY